MEASIALPPWLAGTTSPDSSIESSTNPETRKQTKRELEEMTFTLVFERVLEKMVSGATLNAAVEEDGRIQDVGKFRRWIHKDPQRKAAYSEAEMIRTDAWADKLVDYGEAAATADIPEDVQRFKVKSDNLKWLMGTHNRRKYGASQQIEINQNISITAALAQARGRVFENAVASVELDALEGGDSDG